MPETRNIMQVIEMNVVNEGKSMQCKNEKNCRTKCSAFMGICALVVVNPIKYFLLWIISMAMVLVSERNHQVLECLRKLFVRLIKRSTRFFATTVIAVDGETKVSAPTNPLIDAQFCAGLYIPNVLGT